MPTVGPPKIQRNILEHGDLTKKNPGKMMENIGTW
jgi:hypothetical protein